MNTNTPFANWPNLASEIEKRALCPADAKTLTDFARDGYLVIDLDIKNFDDIAATVIEEMKPLYDGGHRVQDAWRRSRHVKDIACNPKILATLDLLHGRHAFPFQTLNFNVGTEQATHSDTIHFHAVPAHFMCGAWVALENTDANNGPLHYYPGSHKTKPATLADANVRGSGTPEDYSAYETHYVPLIRQVIESHGFKPHEAYLKKGQAFIWAANLLHGGSPIRQPGRTRHSQVTHYYFEDCIYYTPLWSDEALGRLYHRNPFNIATGKPVKSSYCGSPFTPPLPLRAKELLKNMVSHVSVSKKATNS